MTCDTCTYYDTNEQRCVLHNMENITSEHTCNDHEEDKPCDSCQHWDCCDGC